MTPAPRPPNEAKRLRTLREYEILDTPPEAALDEIARLASAICGTPIALISLVDAERLWFKSRIGLEAAETPRDSAFCTHAILQPGVMEVADVRADDRFAGNPLVTGDPRIRFYGGAPLVAPSGDVLGTLCVLDREPRRLTDSQREALQILSRQVVAQIELAHHVRQLEGLMAERGRTQAAMVESERHLCEVLEGPAGRGFAGHIRDTSERREVERLKQEFVSTVSHELRTPLTSIRGSLTLLASGAVGELPPDARDMVAIAERNTVRLITLINDILDLERLECGRVEIRQQRVEANAVVTRAVESVAAVAARHGIRIDVSIAEVAVWADPNRIVQVLVNFLANAIKFSPGASVVTVSVVPEESRVGFFVQDHGRGIPESHRAAIFERFHQVEGSDARRKGGTGLGLAICRAIIEQHGGSIGVESDPGSGSTFWFRIPSATAKPEQAEASPVPATAVLVCEENTRVREYIERTLRSAGFAVVATTSTSEAWNRLQHDDVAVVVTHEGGPRSDVANLIARAHGDARFASLPVVLIGGSVLLHSDAALDPLTVFVPEPIDAHQVLRAVQSALRHAQRDEVLIVEDDPQLLGVLARQLTSQGIRVRTATSGDEAIRLATERHPGLLVLDVELPHGDGFVVVDALRGRPDLGRIPILVYTGLDLSDADRDRLRLGPTRFLTKSKATVQDFQTLVSELRRASLSTASEPIPMRPSEDADEDSHRR